VSEKKIKPFWRKSQWYVPLALLCGGLYVEFFATDISLGEVCGFGIILVGVLYLRLNDITHKLEG